MRLVDPTHTPISTETSPVMPFSELSVSCPAFALCHRRLSLHMECDEDKRVDGTKP